MTMHESTAALHRPTLLLADDEPTTLEVMEMFLFEAGYDQVLRTSDAREVVPMMAEHAPDLLLLNLMMPHRDGIELLGEIREHSEIREIPVIIVTGSTDPDSKQRAMDAGASDFLRKPIDPSELSLRVRNTLSAAGRVILPRRPSVAEQAPPPAPAPAPRVRPSGNMLVSCVLSDDERSTKILRAFVERLRDKLGSMERALEQGDYPGLRELGHWLKGAAGTVGFIEFIGPADDMRAQAAEQKAEALSSTIQQVWDLVDRIALPATAAPQTTSHGRGA